jgi:glycosyltransferase involved in cell wall biosynthesis
MRILILAKEVPWPESSGYLLRVSAVVNALRRAGHELFVVAYAQPGSFEDGSTSQPPEPSEPVTIDVPAPSRADRFVGLARFQSVSASKYYSSHLVRTLRSMPRVDLALIESSHLLPLARYIDAEHLIVDFHNIESDLIRSYASTQRMPASWLVRAEAKSVARLEHRFPQPPDSLVFVSDTDARRFGAQRVSTMLCPNGVYPQPTDRRKRAERRVLFTALLGWAPNAQAATWLARDIWPHVIRRVPDARLQLVGRDPGPEVQALANASIDVVGTVPSVAPYLEAASVAVAPLLTGGGTRLKILEAAAHGLPVVASSVGAEGLEELWGRGVLVADDAETFGSTVADLLVDPQAAHELGATGRELVLDRFGWSKTLQPLVDCVASLAG